MPDLIYSGQMLNDSTGRCFVMETNGSNAILQYEDGQSRSIPIKILEISVLDFTNATIQNILALKKEMRRFGITETENPFADHDKLISEIKNLRGGFDQRPAIRNSAQFRSQVNAMRKIVADHYSLDEFDFNCPPPRPNYDKQQIENAKKRLKKLGYSCVILPIGLLLLILVCSLPQESRADGEINLFIQWILDLIVIISILALLSVILFPITYIIIGMPTFGLGKIAGLTIASKEMKMVREFSTFRVECDTFLRSEYSRLANWMEQFWDVLYDYRKILVKHLTTRSTSPWTLDMVKIESAIDTKYPELLTACEHKVDFGSIRLYSYIRVAGGHQLVEHKQCVFPTQTFGIEHSSVVSKLFDE